MASVIVVGAKGRMGQLVCAAVEAAEGLELAGGYDVENTGELDATAPAADLVIDFSRPASLEQALWGRLAGNLYEQPAEHRDAHLRSLFHRYWQLSLPALAQRAGAFCDGSRQRTNRLLLTGREHLRLPGMHRPQELGPRRGKHVCHSDPQLGTVVREHVEDPKRVLRQG